MASVADRPAISTNLTPRDALRETNSPAKELSLTEPGVANKTMLAQLALVNRPLVCPPKMRNSAALASAFSTCSTASTPMRWTGPCSSTSAHGEASIIGPLTAIAKTGIARFAAPRITADTRNHAVTSVSG